MGVTLLAFGLIAAPVSLALGFAAATISFTAWNIMVPLLLNGFKMDVTTTLFISVMLDLFNAGTLTLVYGYHGKVDWWYGVYFGSISAAMAALISNVLVGVVGNSQSALSGLMFVIPFLLSGGFCYKGAVVLWRRRKQHAAELASAAMPLASFTPSTEDDGATTDLALAEGISSSGSTFGVTFVTAQPPVNLPVTAVTPRPPRPLLSRLRLDERSPSQEGIDLSRTSGEHEAPPTPRSTISLMLQPVQEVIHVPPMEQQHVPLLAPLPKEMSPASSVTHRRRVTSPLARTSTSAPTKLRNTVVADADLPADDEEMALSSSDGENEENDSRDTNRSGGMSNHDDGERLLGSPPNDLAEPTSSRPAVRLLMRFKPDLHILRADMKLKRLRIALMCTMSVIMGSLSGALFIGGGMVFALATASIFNTNVRMATGTGCFICCLTMIAASFAFVRESEENNEVLEDVGYYLMLTVPFGILGAVAGVHLSMRISDTAIFFFISGVLFVLGLGIVVQSTLTPQ